LTHALSDELSGRDLVQVAGKVGSAALASLFAFTILATPAPAVTNEQLLFLEVRPTPFRVFSLGLKLSQVSCYQPRWAHSWNA
jgi:hypothetical protein